MAYWVVTLAIGVGLGLWLAIRQTGGTNTDRLALVVLPTCGLWLAVSFVERILAGPFWDWNAVRLASAFVVAQGHDLYPSLTEGASISYIYGPGFALAFLPATLAGQATTAILIGMALQLAYFLLPVLLFHLLSKRADQHSAIGGLLGFFAFAMIALGNPALRYSGFSLHADAPTLALLLTACALALTASPPTSTRRMATIGLLVALAVWCKQPAAPIAVALPIWFGLTEGWRQSARAVLVMGVVGAVVSALMLVGFGYQDLVLNMFTLPSAVPWKPSADGRWALFFEHLQELARMSVPFVLLMIVGAVLGFQRRSSTGGATPGWLDGRRWPLLFLVGLMMVPTSILGIVKRGGGANSLSFTIFFLALAGTIALADAARGNTKTRAPVAMLLLVALNIGLAARLVAADPTAPERGWDFAQRLGENPQQQAHNALVAHPGEIYFPWNPLAHLMVEGRLYHIEYGVNERGVAGVPMSMEQFRAHVPPAMRLLAFQPRRQTEWTRRDYLTDFSTPTEEVEELPGWNVYVRAPARDDIRDDSPQR